MKAKTSLISTFCTAASLVISLTAPSVAGVNSFLKDIAHHADQYQRVIVQAVRVSFRGDTCAVALREKEFSALPKVAPCKDTSSAGIKGCCLSNLRVERVGSEDGGEILEFVFTFSNRKGFMLPQSRLTLIESMIIRDDGARKKRINPTDTYVAVFETSTERLPVALQRRISPSPGHSARQSHDAFQKPDAESRPEVHSMADSRSNAGGTVSGSHVQTTSHASGHEQSFTPEALTGNPFARQDQPEPAPATSWKRLPHHGSDTTPRGESASTVASRFASGLSGHSSQPAMDAGNSPFAHVKRNPAPDNRARRVERDDNGRIISETPPAWTPPPEAENMHEGLWQMIGQ